MGAYVRPTAVLALVGGFVALNSRAHSAPGARVALSNTIRVLDCLTFGLAETDLDKVRDECLMQWLDRQLHPAWPDVLPQQARAQVDSLAISHQSTTTLVAEVAEKGKELRNLTNPDLKRAAQQAFQQSLNEFSRQAATRDFLRDPYSLAQLRGRMTWFWFNHFNVHPCKADIRPLIGDYVDSVGRMLSAASAIFSARHRLTPPCCVISTQANVRTRPDHDAKALRRRSA